eukprot:2985741-Alexandrium_andersonii.AAC.1
MYREAPAVPQHPLGGWQGEFSSSPGRLRLGDWRSPPSTTGNLPGPVGNRRCGPGVRSIQSPRYHCAVKQQYLDLARAVGALSALADALPLAPHLGGL